MTDGVNRQFLLAARPVGLIKESDFRYNEAEIPVPGEGEVLVRNQIVGVEPALRGQMEGLSNYVTGLQIGEVMRAGGAGEVVASNNPNFKVGDKVQGMFGFQDYACVGGDPVPLGRIPKGTPLEAALYVFGGTGFTAYYGMVEIGEPKEGDAVLVSGAAGAVGSLAGQIAKIKGATNVVGLAGSDEKCSWLVNEMGFTAAINYKTEDIDARVKELMPNGANIFFDNVGGEILDIALNNLAMNARVVICGGISRYEDREGAPGPKNYFSLVYKRARMEGFIIIDNMHRAQEFTDLLGGWINEGKLKYQVDMIEGFQNLPTGLIRLFTGANMGKQLIKIDAAS
ncbi:MAG: NADP-dependent oxidoreductase [Proteobacteria bacterium]|nr:NADP-dependent oxidoreductase [Pseudomonadota bacterium]